MSESGSTMKPEISASDTPWDPPYPHGRPAAIGNMATVAAPFLGGIALALLGLVLGSPTAFGLIDLSLPLLVVSAVAFIAAVQCGFHARQYVSTPDEIMRWWPEPNEARRALLVDEQNECTKLFDRWATRANRAYNLGLIGLGTATASLLVPEGGFCSMGASRLVAFSIVLGAVVVEVAWMLRLIREEKPPQEA